MVDLNNGTDPGQSSNETLQQNWTMLTDLSSDPTFGDELSNTTLRDNISEQLTIKDLFPLVGSGPIALGLGRNAYNKSNHILRSKYCLGFLFYFFLDLRRENVGPVEKTEKKKESKGPEGVKLVVLILSMVFFFLYVGLEVAFGIFITPFAVKCRLGNHLSCQVL